MRRLILAAALAGFMAPVSAQSLSLTLSAVSDYTFDGVSQNNEDPTAQGSLDLEFESGFYLGVWASGVDFGDDEAYAEVDYYGGFAGQFNDDWGYDVGVAAYTYVGADSSIDYTEVYFGLVFPTGTEGYVYFADDDDVFGGSAWRAKFLHSFELSEGLTFDVEATRTTYSDDSLEDFTHAQFGFSKSLGMFDAYLGYSDTSLDDNPLADGRVLFTLSTTIELF